MRHLYKICILGEHLIHFYQHEFFAYRIEPSIPKDAKFVRLWADSQTEKVWVVMEHPSFPEVEEGGIISTYPTMTMDWSETMFRDFVKENLFYLSMEKAIEEDKNVSKSSQMQEL